MGRFTGSPCKQCRRAKEKLFLKGGKCYLAKCPVTKRPYAPGQHGNAPTRPMRLSEYGLRLREKQEAKQIYGLTETQFNGYFFKAEKAKGITGENLLVLLEKRLDNVAYRLGLAHSRAAARQLVRHRHVKVNGGLVNIPSYQVKAGDVINIKDKSAPTVKKTVEAMPERKSPDWLSLDKDKLEGKILRIPARDDIDTLVEEQLIVEFYSR
jgi:small subunit ribosomal protein S4